MAAPPRRVTQERAVDIGKPRRVITVEPEPEPQPVTAPLPVPADPHEQPVPAVPNDRHVGLER